PSIPGFPMLARTARETVISRNFDLAPPLHGLHRIANEIDEHLAELLSVSTHGGQIRTSTDRKFAVGAFGFQHPSRALHHLGDIYLTVVGTSGTSITENRTHNSIESIDFFQDNRQKFTVCGTRSSSILLK